MKKLIAILAFLPSVLFADWSLQFGTNERNDWSLITRIPDKRVGGQQQALAEGKEVVVVLTQSLNGGSVSEFYDYIESDGAEDWKQTVADRVLQTEGAIWQAGNEINSKTKRSATTDSISNYVEYFLAPTLSGIIRADNATGRYTRLMLGSIANASSDRSRDWLRSLLDYTVKGTFSPEFTGSQVRDIIDFATIHYMSKRPEDFPAALADIESMGVPVWATEEVGRKFSTGGLGGAMALRVFDNYLNTGINALLWGSLLGSPTGDEAMQSLYDFLGPVDLVEQDGFWDAGNKRVKIMTDTFSSITMNGWRGSMTAEIHVYKQGSMQVVIPTIRRTSVESVTFEATVTLGTNETALLMVSQ